MPLLTTVAQTSSKSEAPREPIVKSEASREPIVNQVSAANLEQVLGNASPAAKNPYQGPATFGDDENDGQIGADGRRKSLTSRLFGMRRMYIEGSYDQHRNLGLSEDGRIDIVGERCKALADAAKRIAESLRAEPPSSPRKIISTQRKTIHHGSHSIVDNFLGRKNRVDEDDTTSEPWSPGNATECEPTPTTGRTEVPVQPSPPGPDGDKFHNMQTPVQSRFIAKGGADTRGSLGGGGGPGGNARFGGGVEARGSFGGGSGSARFGGGSGSPALTSGGYLTDYNLSADLGGAGRLPPADLDQMGQPLDPTSPDNVLRDLANRVASLREEVLCDREAQRHEAHVRQVGLLADAEVKIPGWSRGQRGGQRSVKGMMDPVWNEQGLANSRAGSTLELEGTDISLRLRTLTSRVGQLYAEVHHGEKKVEVGQLVFDPES